MSLLRGENDSKQSDEFQATCPPPYKTIIPTVFPLTNYVDPIQVLYLPPVLELVLPGQVLLSFKITNHKASAGSEAVNDKISLQLL